MTKIVQLQYPDEAHNRKIVDDLTVLSRNTGQRGHRAVAAFDTEDPAFEGVEKQLIQRAGPLGEVSEPEPPEPDPTEATVTNGQAIPITGGTVTLTVAGGVITGGTFEPD